MRLAQAHICCRIGAGFLINHLQPSDLGEVFTQFRISQSFPVHWEMGTSYYGDKHLVFMCAQQIFDMFQHQGLRFRRNILLCLRCGGVCWHIGRGLWRCFVGARG